MIRRFIQSALLLVVLLTATAVHGERMVLLGVSYGKNLLAICDSEGNVLWSHETDGPMQGHAGHHDVQLLENGSILFHDSWTKLTEVTLSKQVAWTYDSAVMNGNQGKSVDVHAFARLPNGRTMIAESGVGRIIEVERDGTLAHQFVLRDGGTKSTRLVRITPQGTYLVCSENPGIVTEYSREGKVLWEYLIKTRVYGAIRLRNGNTLIASGSGNSVVEVTPEREVVWEIGESIAGTDIQLGWTTCLKETPNGNFVIGNCHAGPNNPQIVEVDREKKVVWEFDEYELVGNGLACWQLLDDQQSQLVRSKLAAVKSQRDSG